MCTEEQTFNYIKGIGNFEINPCDFTTMNNKNLKKLELSTSQKAHMNLFVSQLPAQLATTTISKAYVITNPNGLIGEPMRYKGGGIGSIIKGQDGKIIGHTSLYQLSEEMPFLDTFLTSFSIMSIATGQYFLTQINSELKMINQEIDKIIDFLYGDKKAELISEISFTQYAHKNFSSIMSNESQRIATIVSLQESRKVAMKDIEFYLCDLNVKTNQLSKSYSEFETLSNEAFQIKDSLELSMQLYVMSSIMEIYYAQNNHIEYINSSKEDMTYYINKCEKRILSAFSKLNGYNDTFKSTPIKKIDTSVLGQKFIKLIDSLNIGEDSQIRKIINSALDNLLSSTEYYLTSDGTVYVNTQQQT